MNAPNRDVAREQVQNSEFVTRARCKQHNYLCRIDKGADVNVFGAPCVDDSTIGSLKTDDGNSRLDPWFSTTCFSYAGFSLLLHVGRDMMEMRRVLYYIYIYSLGFWRPNSQVTIKKSLATQVIPSLYCI